MTLRVFTCHMTEDGASGPALVDLLAEDEVRARLLVRRELLDKKRALSVDVYEGGRLLWTEQP